MIRSAAMLLPLALTAVLSACARQPVSVASAQSSRAQCFLASQVSGFGNAIDTSVDVKVGASRYFRLALLGPCHDIDWSTTLALRTTGGSSWICEGNDAEIFVPGPIGGRCLVTDVRPITREQWNVRER